MQDILAGSTILNLVEDCLMKTLFVDAATNKKQETCACGITVATLGNLT